MRIRFYSKHGTFLDEFISNNEFINLSGTCLLHNAIYEILEVKPFIKKRDCNNQEYIRVTARRLY